MHSSIQSVTFPKYDKNLVIIIIALSANGISSYRDCWNLTKLGSELWNPIIHILTDNINFVKKCQEYKTPNTIIVEINSKTELLSKISKIIISIKPKSDLLFCISSHGYSATLPKRKKLEMNGKSEYVKVCGEKVFDYELFYSLYEDMKRDTNSLCLLDTCHSGTLLDLEYISSDGKHFKRSKTKHMDRSESFCISACSDNECTGEDISLNGGWGGKLMGHFIDYMYNLKSEKCKSPDIDSTIKVNVINFYLHIYSLFTHQRYQKTHPIISYNN